MLQVIVYQSLLVLSLLLPLLVSFVGHDHHQRNDALGVPAANFEELIITAPRQSASCPG